MNKYIAVFAMMLFSVNSYAQDSIPSSIEEEIKISCSDYNRANLYQTCIQQSGEAYLSWVKFTTEPEFNDISEIVSGCSVDWPGYIMRVECVTSETKALIRMNNLVNKHGIKITDMSKAANSCSDYHDMSYAILESCIRKELVAITGKPLP